MSKRMGRVPATIALALGWVTSLGCDEVAPPATGAPDAVDSDAGPAPLDGVEPMDSAAADALHVDAWSDGGAGAVLSLEAYAGGGTEELRAVLPLADGERVLAGNFTSSISIGGATLLSQGADDLFVARLDAAGRARWARSFGSSEVERVSGAVLDRSGDVVLVGVAAGPSVDFGGGPLDSAGGPDPFVLKLSGEDGAHRWSRRMPGPGVDLASAVAVDGLGAVFVIGHHAAGIDLGRGPLLSAGGVDFFLARYDGGDGSYVWGISRGGPGNDRAEALAVDGAGTVLVTGAYDQPASFGGRTLTTSSGSLFIAAYAAVNGLYAWARGFADGAGSSGRALAIGPGGELLMLGQYRGAAELDGRRITARGESDLLLARFTPADGVTQWVVSLGSAGADLAESVAVGPGGAVLVGGEISAALELPGSTLPGAGEADLLVAELSLEGELRWARVLGGPGADGLHTLCMAGERVLAGGYFGAPMLLEGHAARYAGGISDALLVELTP